MSFASSTNTLVSSLATTVTSYNNSIKPHHILALYTTSTVLKNTKLYRKVCNLLLTLLSSTTTLALPMVYSNLIPDFLVRWAIRIRCRDHLAILKQEGAEADHQTKMDIVAKLKTMPLAIATKEANEQHYEVPAAFYDLCLGPCKKYSSGLWPAKNTTFDESEIAMLDLYCQRAELEDGMKIVDLGCGWGSLTLHICKKYPNAKITSISNSHSQKEHILNTARERRLHVENITVVTCDVSNDKGALDVVKDNDRVCSVEMLVLHFIYSQHHHFIHIQPLSHYAHPALFHLSSLF